MAAANVASAGESPAFSAVSPACALSNDTSVTTEMPAAESETAVGRRGARDRAALRSPCPSVALMTRAYVSLITPHAAASSFVPKHQFSCGLPKRKAVRGGSGHGARAPGRAGLGRD